ncbi:MULTISPECIES: MarR family transcriptional regulator [Paraburkholderia]|uniref:MarR family transcriptional regulator n=1 Tax=Paraburkholderia TaxID=1822464 RepID=UPI001FE47829|nr:helix-turn-helix domain-containing protein [Paraburkholderia podalyriae]
MAADVLLTTMDFYFEDRRTVPAPSHAQKGEELAALPASVSAKVLLLNAMIDQKVTPAELARRLNTSPQAVNRTVDHAIKIDTIAEALEALGKHLEIAVV